MGIAARRLAMEHIDCNVSLELYNDTCLCLQCNDCDVIIMNFGPSKIMDDDDPKPRPVCAIGTLVAMDSIGPLVGMDSIGPLVGMDSIGPLMDEQPTPPLDVDCVCEEVAVIDDFNKKFYDSDIGQIDEGDENDEIREDDGRGFFKTDRRQRPCPERISDCGFAAEGDSSKLSEWDSLAAGGTCYFGKPADDIDSGSPSQSDEEYN